LGHNKICGQIPNELFMVERLKELILNDNALTGPVPEFLAKMPMYLSLIERNRSVFL
jgi:hypothetical protein